MEPLGADRGAGRAKEYHSVRAVYGRFAGIGGGCERREAHPWQPARKRARGGVRDPDAVGLDTAAWTQLRGFGYTRRAMSNEDDALGPLAALVGIWEGDKGADLAPAVPDRGEARSDYRERMTFESIGRVDNHEQVLYGLRYATMAWRVGADAPFHEEVGYWLWDATHRQVMRCFIVPRGVSVIAGGTAQADATSFSLEADAGSATYGICSNPFLEREFKTIRYTLTVSMLDADTLRYEEDTVMQVSGRDEPFHHTDANTLRRVP